MNIYEARPRRTNTYCEKRIRLLHLGIKKSTLIGYCAFVSGLCYLLISDRYVSHLNARMVVGIGAGGNVRIREHFDGKSECYHTKSLTPLLTIRVVMSDS